MTETVLYPTGHAIRKTMRRLLPFLLLMYVLAFLDRTNIGFAQKAFQHDRGLSDAAFAFGAGLFFVGYAVFEVPSNLMLHRVGARVWMCRIMVTWGLISAAMVAANTPTAFYVLRLLLGMAEAGFFPGIIYYLTYWLPQSARARAIGVFYFGAPLAFIFGSPLSGLLLELHGTLGMAGWQWLFLVEGILASAVGVWAFWYLDNKPEEANWLTESERRALVAAIEGDAQEALTHGPRGVLAALVDRRVLLYALVYALIQFSVYGVIFFLPQQVASLLGTTVGFKVGMVTTVPWLCSLAAVWIAPRYADRSNTHAQWAAALLVIAGLGIAVSGFAGHPLLAMVGLCFAAGGFIAAQPLFWTLATHELTGIAAASAIALINSLGGLGGFVAPLVRSAVAQASGFRGAGLEVLASASLIAAFLIVLIARRAATQTQYQIAPHAERVR